MSPRRSTGRGPAGVVDVGVELLVRDEVVVVVVREVVVVVVVVVVLVVVRLDVVS
ncbi:hypothetical protein [Herbihabitans rhizosphaerae]|uniref:hypothetical protein n=1 Tax=Herbihabitans rhizosphaerae TaxID=1872711 RepID=UPI001F5F660F|nr:hypothetical protein [Herbihabitans rhizosphaerae]